MKFVDTAKKLSTPIPELMAIDANLSPETLEKLKGMSSMLVGVDYAQASDMTALSIAKQVPDGGKPGQVLGVGSSGDPEWVAFPFDKALPPKSDKLSIDQVLQGLTDNGIHVESLDVNHGYFANEYPKITLSMTVVPDPSQASGFMSKLHEWVANNAPWGKKKY